MNLVAEPLGLVLIDEIRLKLTYFSRFSSPKSEHIAFILDERFEYNSIALSLEKQGLLKCWSSHNIRNNNLNSLRVRCDVYAWECAYVRMSGSDLRC